MKKLIIALTAVLMMGSAAMAQDEQKQNRRPSFDPKEMIQRRTDMVVKRYGLDNKQAKQLLELNTKYADKMRPRGPRGGHPGMGGGMHHGAKPDSLNQGRAPRQPREMPEFEKEYEQELQKIMSESQYKSYQEDMEKRRKEGPREQRGQRGQRPHKRDSNS